MNRREALSAVGLLLGGTIIGSEVFLTGCSSSPEKVNQLFNVKDVALMDEIAETIIPETNTPGAKAAKTGEFMAIMVQDCYTADEQKVFLDGLKTIDKTAGDQYSKKFIDLDKDQRKALLIGIDKENKDYDQSKNGDKPHYFRMMKELTMLGYFTSEVGGTQQLTYVEVPGRWDACIDYKKGDPVYLNP
ncbi:MAG: gluconate 2-dehydrogenase subunit 3 family protein [Pedobacter sp.]|nr:MAG: gluconate 2-dehydrogenase subunit 3 family protein [Pedobacter sp.]